jgi:hypothetical protein
MQTELENTPECMFGAGHKPYRIIGHRKVNGLVEYEVLFIIKIIIGTLATSFE